MSPPETKMPEQKTSLPQIPVGNIAARQAPQMSFGRQPPPMAGGPGQSLGAGLMSAGAQMPQRREMAGALLGRG